jgi:hypothetical protein
MKGEHKGQSIVRAVLESSKSPLFVNNFTMPALLQTMVNSSAPNKGDAVAIPKDNTNQASTILASRLEFRKTRIGAIVTDLQSSAGVDSVHLLL